MKNEIKLFQLSSLDKVYLDDDYRTKREVYGKSSLKGERVSYQIMYTGGNGRDIIEYSINADKGINVVCRKVGNINCPKMYMTNCDEHYEKTTPGLYPDVLYPTDDNKIEVSRELCNSLYITCEISNNIKAGKYPVEITFKSGDRVTTKVFDINVLDAVLPKQDTLFMHWFHADCIASAYNLEIFSDAHWDMIGKYIEMAVHIGMNSMFVPIFTPPLDTAIDTERATVQLIDVTYKKGKYTFGFERLKKWMELAKSKGMEKFEISHLFTQWGSGCAPKIVAETENGTEKIFGWKNKISEPEYPHFLNEFLPRLVEFLKTENYYDDCLFHLSDEPFYPRDYSIYKQEFDMINKLIPMEKFTDAISHFEFYRDGLSHRPIVVTSSIDDFFEKGCTDLYAYVCCGPDSGDYGNRMIGMPSYRNRILGMQLYRYGINGFLHWGFNFYYNEGSVKYVDPYYNRTEDNTFPAGDAYSVYPGKNGPIESIRSVVFYEALQDIRACKLLEKYIGREEVVKLLEFDGELKFNKYPMSIGGVELLRDRINDRLSKCLGNSEKSR